jgi:hypothetical protein
LLLPFLAVDLSYYAPREPAVDQPRNRLGDEIDHVGNLRGDELLGAQLAPGVPVGLVPVLALVLQVRELLGIAVLVLRSHRSRGLPARHRWSSFRTLSDELLDGAAQIERSHQVTLGGDHVCVGRDVLGQDTAGADSGDLRGSISRKELWSCPAGGIRRMQ